MDKTCGYGPHNRGSNPRRDAIRSDVLYQCSLHTINRGFVTTMRRGSF